MVFNNASESSLPNRLGSAKKWKEFRSLYSGFLENTVVRITGITIPSDNKRMVTSIAAGKHCQYSPRHKKGGFVGFAKKRFKASNLNDTA